MQALAGDDHQVLNSVRRPFAKFCMYSERNSGSNWVSKLIQVTSPASQSNLDYLSLSMLLRSACTVCALLSLLKVTLTVWVVNDGTGWIIKMRSCGDWINCR